MEIGEQKTLAVAQPVSIGDKGGYLKPLSIDLLEGVYEIDLSLTYTVSFASIGPKPGLTELVGSVSLDYSLPYIAGETKLRPKSEVKGQRGNSIWLREVHHDALGQPGKQGPFTFGLSGVYDCSAGSQTLEFYIRLDAQSMPRGIMSLTCTAGSLEVRRRA